MLYELLRFSSRRSGVAAMLLKCLFRHSENMALRKTMNHHLGNGYCKRANTVEDKRAVHLNKLNISVNQVYVTTLNTMPSYPVVPQPPSCSNPHSFHG